MDMSTIDGGYYNCAKQSRNDYLNDIPGLSTLAQEAFNDVFINKGENSQQKLADLLKGSNINLSNVGVSLADDNGSAPTQAYNEKFASLTKDFGRG